MYIRPKYSFQSGTGATAQFTCQLTQSVIGSMSTASKLFSEEGRSYHALATRMDISHIPMLMICRKTRIKSFPDPFGCSHRRRAKRRTTVTRLVTAYNPRCLQRICNMRDALDSDPCLQFLLQSMMLDTLTPERRYGFFSAVQVKFFSSLLSPLPLYFAT